MVYQQRVNIRKELLKMITDVIISFELPSDEIKYKEYEILVEDFMRGLQLYCGVEDVVVTEESDMEVRIR